MPLGLNVPSTPGPRLGYVLPGPILSSGGLVAMEARGFSGLTELARSWPGRVIVLAPAVNAIPEPLPLAYATADVDSLGSTSSKLSPSRLRSIPWAWT